MKRSRGQGNIPEGWRLVRLGDVAHIRNNRATGGENGRIPYVALEHILSGGKLTTYGKSADSVSTKTEFSKGDTLYGKLRPNLRKRFGVIRAEFDGVCSTEILAIFAKGQEDGRFLSHLIRSDLLHGHAMQGITGTKMPRTSWGHLKTFEFLSPPLPERRAIAAVLDSIDEAIEGAEAVIASTEQLRDSLLHQLLTRGVPGWHTEWKDVPGLGTIPADWEVVRLGEVAEVTFSSVDKKTVEGEVPVLLCNYTDVFYNRRIRPEMDFMVATANPVERKRWALNRGDVLFTKDSETPDEIGIPAFVEADMPNVLCGYHLGLARPDAQMLQGTYLAEAFASPKLAVQFARIANGVTRFGLTLGATNQLPIPLPPLVEQQAIAGSLDGVDATVAEGKRERDTLQLLKESTADALLTGRVRVVHWV